MDFVGDNFDVATGRTTVHYSFFSTSRDGSPVAPLSAYDAADFRIYKDGSDTQRTSQAGWTVTSPFDSIVGLHHISIDLTENTDAGFYANNHHYELHLIPNDETVDGLVAQAVLCSWYTGGAGAGSAPTAAEVADAVWDEDATGHQTGGTFGQAIGDPAADTHTIYGAVVTGAAGVDIAADIVAVKADTAAILVDTNELQTDWTNGGRLDLLIDAIKAITDVLISPATIATAVWASATRLLTAGTNIVLAKGVGVTGFNDLSASQVNTEADTALADYDGPTHAEMTAELATADDATLAAVAALSIPTATENADALLKRDWTAVSGEAARSVLNAMRLLRNKVTRTATTLTVTKEDDSSSAWTAALTTDAALDPITDLDPS